MPDGIFFGTYSRDWLDQGNDDPFGFEPKLTRAVKNIRNHATVSATAVFSPSLIGEFRSGFARSVFQQFPQRVRFRHHDARVPQSVCGPGADQELPVFRRRRIGPHRRIGFRRPKFGGMNSWGQRDALTWVKGTHTLKFGGDYRVQQMNQFLANSLLRI